MSNKHPQRRHTNIVIAESAPDHVTDGWCPGCVELESRVRDSLAALVDSMFDWYEHVKGRTALTEQARRVLLASTRGDAREKGRAVLAAARNGNPLAIFGAVQAFLRGAPAPRLS